MQSFSLVLGFFFAGLMAGCSSPEPDAAGASSSAQTSTGGDPDEQSGARVGDYAMGSIDADGSLHILESSDTGLKFELHVDGRNIDGTKVDLSGLAVPDSVDWLYTAGDCRITFRMTGRDSLFLLQDGACTSLAVNVSGTYAGAGE